MQGGTLILSNVGLVRDGGSRLKHLLRVEDGHLVVSRCRLLSRGAVETGGGGLVAFQAATSRPLQDVPGPFGAASDLASCRLIDSVLITGGMRSRPRSLAGSSRRTLRDRRGGDALTLLPRRVARHRFRADLWLDRCTLVAGRGAVALGPWPGEVPGPDRPWLVSTQGSAFLDGSNRIPREGILLRVEPDAFARGLLFWQAVNDAYEVGRFVAGTDAPPAPIVRPDVRHQWVNLWARTISATCPARAWRVALQVSGCIDGLRPGEEMTPVTWSSSRVTIRAVKPSTSAPTPDDSASRRSGPPVVADPAGAREGRRPDLGPRTPGRGRLSF